MKALLQFFWQMLRFKRGPEDAPYSPALLLLVIIANFMITAGAQLIARPAHTHIALVMPLISITVEIIAVYFFLHLKQLNARFVQTAISIFFCDTLLTLLAIPLLVVSLQLGTKSPLLTVFGVFELVLTMWSIMLRGFIYHRAMNIGPFLANTLAFMLMIISISITIKIFPDLLAQAKAVAQSSTQSR